MTRLPLVMVVAAAGACLARLAEALVPGPSVGRHVASLLKQGQQQKKRWDVKTATEEMHTEWGIVLRRYYMVDMELTDIALKLDALAPDPRTSPEPPEAPDAEAAAVLKRKIAKLSGNLEAARADLDSSESTVVNMEVDPHLDGPAKEALNKEHQQQQEQAEVLSHLGEEAGQAATSALAALEQLLAEKPPAAGAAPPPPAAATAAPKAGAVKLRATAMVNATTNATGGAQATTQRTVSSTARTFAAAVGGFRGAARAYQEQRAKLEESARKASARLLTLRQTVRRAPRQ